MVASLVQFKYADVGVTNPCTLNQAPTPGNVMIYVAANRDENPLGPLSASPPAGWTRVPIPGPLPHIHARPGAVDGQGYGHADLMYRVVQAGDTGINYPVGYGILMEWAGIGTTAIDAAKVDINGQTGTGISQISGAPGQHALVIGVAMTRLADGNPNAAAVTPTGGTNRVGAVGSFPQSNVNYDVPAVLWKESTDGSAQTLSATQSGSTHDGGTYYWGMRIAAFASEPAPVPETWDIFAANDLNGLPIAELENAERRFLRVEEDGAGVGGFFINRHSTEATAANLAKGNLVRVRIPEISTGYIGGFFLETGDFEILSSDEQGKELLEFGGRGLFSYLGRARMWNEAYSTGVDLSDTWTEVWKTSKIIDPVGSAVVGGDPTYVYVVSATTRRIYKLRQSDRKVVRTSPALWTGATNYAGGLSADPADATILWVLEAPWSLGGGGNTKIRKVRISDWAVLNTYDLGSAVPLTEVKADSTYLWTSRYAVGNTIQRRTKADPTTVDQGYTISYGGVQQDNATGISVNGTKLAYWYAGKKRALIADSTAPTTITDVIKTTGISAFGGDWTTEAAEDYFYPVSYTADVVWKYQVTVATPHDPVDGEWRLDEGTPGAILARIMAEVQHASRPQQPVPDVTYAFDFDQATDANAWQSHPGTVEFTANVGDFVDDVILRLVPFGLTVQMAPDLELEAYNDVDFGTDRTSATFAAGKVRLVVGASIAEKLGRRLDDRKVDSHLLVVGQAGVSAVAVQNDLGYVREGFLSTDLTDAGALSGTGDAELDRERRDSDAQAVVVPWGDDELNGLYLPGPAGTNGHYWLGDLVRVHSGTGAFDLNEQNREVKAITIEEVEANEWRAIVDLASIFVPIYNPIQPIPPGENIGGSPSSGGGGTTYVSSPIVVKDSANSESYAGTTIESDDWGVSQPGTGRVSVSIRRRTLGELLDVNVDGIAEGGTIAWDSATEAWIPDPTALHVRNAISPPQLTADVNDWNPTGFADAEVVRFSTDASRTISGFLAPTSGAKAFVLVNIGSNNGILEHAGAGSAVGNRLSLPSGNDVTIGAGVAVPVYYDADSTAWRIAGGTGGGGGAAFAASDGSVTVDPVSSVLVDPGLLEDLGGGVARIRGLPSGLIGASAYLSTTQSIANGGESLQYDTVDKDSDGFFDLGTDNTIATVPPGVSGPYLLVATTGFAGGSTTGRRRLAIRLNGAGIPGQAAEAPPSAAGPTSLVSVAFAENLAPGDVIDVNAFQDTGGPFTASADLGGRNRLTLYKLNSGRVGEGVGARVGRTSDLTGITTETVVTWQTAYRDPYGFWAPGDPTKLTVPPGLSGWYLVGSALYYTNLAGGTYAHSRIKLNGSDVHSVRDGQVGGLYLGTFDTLLYLDAGDVLTLSVESDDPSFDLSQYAGVLPGFWMAMIQTVPLPTVESSALLYAIHQLR